MRPANNVVDDINLFGADAVTNKNQYLTFILAGEEYGVDILRVQEIKGWEGVTKIPNAPHYIKGVMNLRGSIVPIIDLRIRFNLDAQEYGPTTVVVVLRVETNDRQRILGVVVDAVSDVYDISAAAMQPPPDFGDNIRVEFLKGLATVENKMVILINVDHLLTYSELSAIKNSLNESSIDVEALENSFAMLAPKGSHIVERFYEELFKRYPDTKSLFQNVSIKSQESKLLAAIQLVVSNIRNPNSLSESLQKLGLRHKTYGANPDLYKAVSETLLDVIKESLGDKWTGNVQKAWKGALDNISEIMQKAAG